MGGKVEAEAAAEAVSEAAAASRREAAVAAAAAEEEAEAKAAAAADELVSLRQEVAAVRATLSGASEQLSANKTVSQIHT